MRKILRVLALLTAGLMLTACGNHPFTPFTEEPAKELSQILEIDDPADFNYELHVYLHDKSSMGADLDVLSHSERTVYLCDWVYDEINADGFALFFYNYGADLPDGIIEAYQEIGAEQTAQIYRDALSAWKEAGLGIEAIWKQETFHQYDELFTACPEDLNLMLRDYVLSRQQDFT